MPMRALGLRAPDRSNGCILRRADGALDVFVVVVIAVTILAGGLSAAGAIVVIVIVVIVVVTVSVAAVFVIVIFVNNGCAMALTACVAIRACNVTDVSFIGGNAASTADASSVKAPLVERVLAHEVDGWKVEAGAAGGAAGGRESDGFGRQIGKFGALGGGIGTEGGRQAVVL